MELKTILEENEFALVLQSVNTLPNKPSRAQIEDVIVDNGYTLPLPNPVRFYLRATDGKVISVIYSTVYDEYYTKKLDKAA